MKSSGRVLTSAECIKNMEEKERIKQQKALIKEQKQKAREEKNREKALLPSEFIIGQLVVVACIVLHFQKQKKLDPNVLKKATTKGTKNANGKTQFFSSLAELIMT